MHPQRADDFIQQVKQWATMQADIIGVLLIGSYARGNAREDSDIDFCIVTKEIDKYLAERKWIKGFGEPVLVECETWGIVKTVRVYFNDGEIEFNFAPPSWAAIDPVDLGTSRVVTDGARILYDSSSELARLLIKLNLLTAPARNA